jgi:orotate phosphoribosyltransferase
MGSNIESTIIENLLQIRAIKLQPDNPFTWASGWKSPIYCDNRKTLSYPEVRENLKQAFAEKVRTLYPDAEVIAGVATGAIAVGVLVAEALNLPFIYVRSSSKDHGLGNQIEGFYKEGQKVVVIEDLISTGGSSLKAIEALRDAKLDVMGMLAIFTYQFNVSVEAFANANCKVDTLTNYTALIELATEKNYITPQQMASLKEWRQHPDTWGK